eukprot:1818847-Amphidinium_carterae.1
MTDELVRRLACPIDDIAIGSQNLAQKVVRQLSVPRRGMRCAEEYFEPAESPLHARDGWSQCAIDKATLLSRQRGKLDWFSLPLWLKRVGLSAILQSWYSAARNIQETIVGLYLVKP